MLCDNGSGNLSLRMSIAIFTLFEYIFLLSSISLAFLVAGGKQLLQFSNKLTLDSLSSETGYVDMVFEHFRFIDDFVAYNWDERILSIDCLCALKISAIHSTQLYHLL